MKLYDSPNIEIIDVISYRDLVDQLQDRCLEFGGEKSVLDFMLKEVGGLVFDSDQEWKEWLKFRYSRMPTT